MLSLQAVPQTIIIFEASLWHTVVIYVDTLRADILIQINIIINMQQSKSPKSIAYSRLGKPNSGKHNVPEQSFARKSTGNIYEDLISQFDPKQQKYVRDLVNKNSNQQAEYTSYHSRRKSYADLEVENSNKSKYKQEKPREVRQTLCKTKPHKQLVLTHQATPKNNNTTQATRSDFVNRSSFNIESQQNKIQGLIQRESSKIPKESFLGNLDNYIEQLRQPQNQIQKLNIGAQKLSQTLKISYGNNGNNGSNENYKYASKIQQQLLKIKQLKLKNHCIEKQLLKRDKIQKKMKNCLYQMLQQIKQINTELSKQKKQRKRLQKVIENFEMRSQQLQRKTNCKNYNLTKIEEFQTKINQFTQNELDTSQLDSSFKEVWKHSTVGNQKSKHAIYISQGGFDLRQRGHLDSNKIQKMFRSNYHSEEQDYIYQ